MVFKKVNTRRIFGVVFLLLSLPIDIWLIFGDATVTFGNTPQAKMMVLLFGIASFFQTFFLLLLIYPNLLIDNKKWLKENKVSFFFYAALVIGLLLMLVDFKSGNLFATDFWNNVLVEAHGMFFDIILFGIILTIYERFTDRYNENKRLQNEIEDFSGWKEPEAMFRVVGNVKRLAKNGIKNINLCDCYLNEAKLKEINLSGSRLTGATFRNADLSFSDLSRSKLIGVDFSNAMLVGVNFQDSKCDMADFKNAFLGGTNFMNVDISSCSFEGARFNLATILEGALIDDLNWFDKQNKLAIDFKFMNDKYQISKAQIQDKNGYSKFIIVRKTIDNIEMPSE